MTTNLPVDPKTISNEELIALTGQSTKANFNAFPRLTINKDVGDDEANPLPIGAFCLKQSGAAVYGKPAKFRAFINAYQYAVYEADVNNYSNRSIIFKSFQDEAVDEKGGVACGRIAKKKQEGLSTEQLAEQKKIKCYRNVYGLVTFAGHTQDGTEVAVDNVPCVMRLSGDNFMPIQEAFDLLSSKKIPMITSELELATERRKQGTNVWYRVVVKADPKNIASLQPSDWDHLKSFQEAIDTENGVIIEKFKATKNKAVAAHAEADVVNALEGDFNDDISHVGQ